MIEVMGVSGRLADFVGLRFGLVRGWVWKKI